VCGVAATAIFVSLTLARLMLSPRQSAGGVIAAFTLIIGLIGGFVLAPHVARPASAESTVHEEDEFLSS
jgi:hypothetical protein